MHTSLALFALLLVPSTLAVAVPALDDRVGKGCNPLLDAGDPTCSKDSCTVVCFPFTACTLPLLPFDKLSQKIYKANPLSPHSSPAFSISTVEPIPGRQSRAVLAPFAARDHAVSSSPANLPSSHLAMALASFLTSAHVTMGWLMRDFWL